MNIEIDPLSQVPLYQQLRDRIVESIAEGRLTPGEQLASVRQLAVAFGVNVATVGKGYELLRQEGLIVTNHKSGSVIARGPHSGAASETFRGPWRARLTTLLAEARAQGLSDSEILTASSEVLAEFASHSGRNDGEEGEHA